MKRNSEAIKTNFQSNEKIPKLLENSSEIQVPHDPNNFDKYRLKGEFFNEDCLTLSKNLLGKYLIRKLTKTLDQNSNTEYLIGRIVEVEAYLGGDDKASHTYNNKLTDRLKAMYMKAGTAYVYNIYGCYCCLNISSKEPGAGVLIRALEPIYGIDIMKIHRHKTASKSLSEKNVLKNLTNGPSKLCISMNITKNVFNQVDLAESDSLWLQDSSELINSLELKNKNFQTVSATRIGINYAGEEAINKLYRFYIKDNIHVSVKSKNPIEIL